MLFGACCTPRSSKTATESAAAMRRAAARNNSSSTPLRWAYSPTGIVCSTSRTSSAPCTCSARKASLHRFSCTSTAASAARHQASVPGFTRRWKSAILAVSVTTGSMTTIERAGSLAMSLSTVRARGKLCDIHGFLPTNTDTSACSNSPRVCPPYSWTSTQFSPVFSWASALDR